MEANIVPSDERVAQAVREILATADLRSTTTKQIIAQVRARGCDDNDSDSDDGGGICDPVCVCGVGVQVEESLGVSVKDRKVGESMPLLLLLRGWESMCG